MATDQHMNSEQIPRIDINLDNFSLNVINSLVLLGATRNVAQVCPLSKIKLAPEVMVPFDNDQFLPIQILPLIQKYKVLHLNKIGAMVNNDVPLEIQRLRCWLVQMFICLICRTYFVTVQIHATNALLGTEYTMSGALDILGESSQAIHLGGQSNVKSLANRLCSLEHS
ncbi:hypothetical protein BS78_K127400 [Paspalum vaginatum]|uniref:Uncharacterized protein n=1 Tax=Paspalum vaginatum TaxID=158149 RepID=A0A9W8CGV9_9POAL|nr:hypothetical protein BS78_K127400 [Paspalum vaginatum]